jgi:fructan beta-fructosidase
MRKKFQTLLLLLFAGLSVAYGQGFKLDISEKSATITLDRAKKQTLWIPIDNSAKEVKMRVEGSPLFTEPVTVRLADKQVECWMPLSLDKATSRIEIDGCKPDYVAWKSLKMGADPNPKIEDYRQHIHFSPEKGWTNDPNGMVWYKGEWHLFFQYNPLGTRWGNMSWGHAVSKDLAKWKQLPTVMYPDSLGMIYSGSAVIDKHNTAGFGKDAMIAIYTSSYKTKSLKCQQQSIAYSLDRGRTFTKYEGNPVLPSSRRNFRDPKVFWHEPTARWIMPLACGKGMEFYSSTNLKEWKFESRFGDKYGCHFDVWECPDLVELPYKGGTKWVLFCSITKDAQHGSSVQYFVGDFDGHTFTCDTPEAYTDWINYGRDNYATVTWSNVSDGRCVALAWQNNWKCCSREKFPTVGYRGYMSLAYELQLVEYEGKAKLISRPAREYDNYFRKEVFAGKAKVEGKSELCRLEKQGSAYRLKLKFDEIDAPQFGLRLSNEGGEWVDICFDRIKREFRVDRRESGAVDFNDRFPSVTVAPMSAAGEQSLTIIIDRASVECFTDVAAASNLVFPTECYNRVELYTTTGSVTVKAEVDCGK